MKKWHNIATLTNMDYTCGYCGSQITSNKGYFIEDSNEKYIYVTNVMEQHILIQVINRHQDVYMVRNLNYQYQKI